MFEDLLSWWWIYDKISMKPQQGRQLPDRYTMEGRCVIMTTYEIIMVFLGIISLLICFGQLLIALLTFLDNKRNKKRKK